MRGILQTPAGGQRALGSCSTRPLILSRFQWVVLSKKMKVVMVVEGGDYRCIGKGVREFQTVVVRGELHPSWGYPLGVVIYRLSGGYRRT